MSRQRDYRAEYARRIARGKARGLSKAQARGHPKPRELLASEKLAPKSNRARRAPKPPQSDEQLEAALTLLREGRSLTRAAKAEAVSADRLRRFIRLHRLARWDGRQWRMSDSRPRRVQTITNGRIRTITADGFKQASRWGHYVNDVGTFLRTSEPEILTPYSGQGVRDTDGRIHPFETNPNALLRLASAGLPAFHEVYEIISK